MHEHAECRGCHKRLDGSPYSRGGIARNPDTGKMAKANYYGGWVCSRECDFRASLELEQSMPGHGHGQTQISPEARRRIDRNWP